MKTKLQHNVEHGNWHGEGTDKRHALMQLFSALGDKIQPVSLERETRYELLLQNFIGKKYEWHTLVPFFHRVMTVLINPRHTVGDVSAPCDLFAPNTDSALLN